MVLPNFLICGAPKCGTTALYEYLRQHPDVFMSRPKETFFFSDEFDRGVEWFAEHFSAHDGEKAIGEASTTTMYSPKAPARIQRVLGSPKLIFCLRNPIERAYSEYFFKMTQGRIPANTTFEDVVLKKSVHQSEKIIRRGMYDEYLKTFESEFGGENMRVVFQSDLKKQTRSEVKGILRYLGVDEGIDLDSGEAHNETKYPNRGLYYWVRQSWHKIRGPVEGLFPSATDMVRQGMWQVLFSSEKPPMSETVRAHLRDVYSKPNARLEQYLDRNLSHWK